MFYLRIEENSRGSFRAIDLKKPWNKMVKCVGMYNALL